MVFSTVPVYLDPPNWNQMEQPHQPQNIAVGIGAGHMESQQLPLAKMTASPCHDGGATTGTPRPVSMVERARLAKIPLPEPALKCPRCESTNTKFCYFNNYSLSQPRHFCKTCRRYWTRGGALRNIPVGGGCRRNKRSKSSGNSSKSSSAASTTALASSATSSFSGISAITAALPDQLSLMSALHPLPPNLRGDSGIGFGLSGIHAAIDPLEYHMGNIAGNNNIGIDYWRLPPVHQLHHQLPFLGALDQPGQEISPLMALTSSVQALNHFEEENIGGGGRVDGFAAHHGHDMIVPRVNTVGAGLITQLAPSVKMEEHIAGLNMPMQFLNVAGSNQYWSGIVGAGGGGGGGGWTNDISGLNSSSPRNMV